ncbi:glycine betaine ABC transporter substrate-binding protein [Chloroflexota bacterium]
MKRILTCVGLVLLVGILLLPGCGQRKITVASKMDAEGAILSQLIIQLLRDNDLEVTDKTWMGSTDIVRKAIINGDIDIYPEYTGNGAKWFKDQGWETWSRFDKNEVAKKLTDLETQDKNKVEWLAPAPANNPWAIAVNSEVANERNLRTIEDFANYVNKPDNNVLVYGSKEFFTSPMALPLFEKKYGFKLRIDQKVIVSSPIYAEHLVAFFDEPGIVYASMAYTTDHYLEEGIADTTSHYLEKLPLWMLADNEHAQPLYHPAPIVRSEVLERYPEIRKILNQLFERLDTETLQELNGDAVQKFPSEVARDYLEQNGLLHKKQEIDDLSYDRPIPDFFKPEEDEKSIEIVNAKITVEPKTIWQTDFYVDDKFMSDVRVAGWFMASGGALNDIKIVILSDIDFTNWKNFHEVKDGVYQSDKITKTQIGLKIKDPGSYHLALSNRFSEFSFKDVRAKVYLYYKMRAE